jgi:hypothetical protein
MCACVFGYVSALSADEIFELVVLNRVGSIAVIISRCAVRQAWGIFSNSVGCHDGANYTRCVL